jgi:hypothetical protein
VKRAGLAGARAAAFCALAAAFCALAAWPAMASGAIGPPAGPTTPPFTQCPAVSADTSCQFLIDVVGSGATQTPVVIQDPSQPFYDSSDDALVAVQNDSQQPLGSLHIGVEGTDDNDFGFDGDGLCAPPTPPVPAGCPFGGSLEDPFDYAGPGMEFEGGSAIADVDAGTVDFTPALQPGQYTYFSLEAQPSVPLVAGNVDDLVTTTLSDAGGNTSDTYGALQEAEPTEVSDTATIEGVNASSADGTVTYRVYADPTCTQLVATAGADLPVDEGNATPSSPVGPELPNNAVYYWQASYSGDVSNSPSVSPCGSETMVFGSPPARAQSGVSASFTGDGQTATALTIPAGASATAGAQITSAAGAPAATGSVTYTLYSDSQCTQQAAGGGTVAVVGDSAAPSPPLALANGTYYLVVSYSGDAHHASLTSGCGVATLTVGGSLQPQECSALASLDPGFAAAEAKQPVISLPSLSSDTLEVSLSAGISLGSVGICDNALSGLTSNLGSGGLALTAHYSLASAGASKKFTYSFVPLGWHIPAGTGAPDATPPPPAIEWPQASEFGGQVHPSLSFTYTPGEALKPSLDLIEVPIAQTSVTLLALGSPFLQASVGPELSFGLSFDKHALAEQEDEDVAEGESPQAAAQEISDELGSDVEGGLESEVGAIDPDAPDVAALATDSSDAASTVADSADATLPGDAATGVGDSAISGAADASLDAGADAVGGGDFLEVLVDLAIFAEAHKPPPPGMVATSGQLLPQRLLPARPLARLSRRALRRAGFPRGLVPALVHSRLTLSVPAKVRPLVVSSTGLRPGRRISILATRLGRGHRHDALFVLQGPDYRATRLVRVVRGAADVTITLPRSLAPGTWTISAQDLSEVHLTPAHTLAGSALVQFGVFTVPRRRHHTKHRSRG